MSREAMQMALDALEGYKECLLNYGLKFGHGYAAIAALRAALAEQPAPVLTDEPVAWLTRDAIDGLWYPTAFAKTPNDRPLYAARPGEPT